MSKVPPPPAHGISSALIKKKHKKRFTISTENILQQNSINRSEDEEIKRKNNYHHEGRVLIIPQLHYGLEKIGTKITLMDRDNLLTHSPTLISFGGYSVFGGIIDVQLLYLDLEPSESGELNVEFEWKLLDEGNSELINLVTVSNLTFHYCKQRQSLLLFIPTDHVNIFEFSLTSRTWEKSKFISPFYDSYFLIDRDEKHLIDIMSSDSMYINCYELSGVFSNMDKKGVELPTPKSRMNAILEEELVIHRDATLPILDEQKILILSTMSRGQNYNYISKSPDLLTINLSGSNPFEHCKLFDEIGSKPTLAEFPKIDKLQKSKVLISVFNNTKKRMVLFVKDVSKHGVEELRYNPLPIELKRHVLFETVSFGFITKKNERRILLMPSNDLIFIIKIDYFAISFAFPFISNMRILLPISDISIICK
ncbi:predicted protein [Naegleria gruberi]|uniref:Predicted protein n=1 Tax=Naegleria gruberi TaxID=5762 RepID=D2VBY4_NAEGR|nr:uncharacterized protein NAEGRDRAFT_66380 [Naegleria gruberi]EFC45558.1 predicted protein [Naegleria gruberi]|eukprot:XP_002678302.1 predicted protein [Naegleria gruberi strain NEG-M]